uniref:C2H2-type domain-containing protein n=1 Tax=Electrophorus electricus TaxID=8005 RepID=A0A4W4HKK1_ELEEL
QETGEGCNGDCSPRKENSRMLVDLSPNAPNGQHSQSPRSPSAHPIKQEEGTEEEGERRAIGPDETGHSGEEGSVLEEPMTDSPNNLQDVGPGTEGPADSVMRLPNGDRPFQCNQCGVSFTQKGNLLRHIKLHTGEKPFKCPFCSYACRRRDALTGHLRTHSVGKPHKCNYCGRSYKQRTSLEEHKERCHNYLQSVGMDPSHSASPYAGEWVPKEQRPLGEVAGVTSFERPPVIERLQASVAKRKSTTPQKFVGEKMLRYSYPDLNFDVDLKYKKEAELMQAHMMDQAINNAISYLGSESLRPVVPHPALAMAEVVPMVNPLFHPVYPIGPHLDRPSSRDALPGPQMAPEFPPPTNGAISLVRPKNPATGREGSPSNSGQDSADSARSSPRDKPANAGGALRPAPRVSPGLARAEEARAGDASRLGSRDGVRVFGREGQELRAFQCEHCRVLFLDHVMYTIHMGCHGYRDPLECNICGHCSKDRYEFSSHIVRGVHTFR